MTFTENDKLKALAIVHVFETSKPFGDYAACVVLNDGAGVSYGINQFTHRSGSLLAVVEAYLERGGKVGGGVMDEIMPLLRQKTAAAITKLSSVAAFKKALRAAAVTREMKEAQNEIAFKLYLRPAIAVCEERGFTLPLSLAVVYDSITHGSWERISRTGRPGSNEKSWITDYVRKRHMWLDNIPRLRSTTYRTRFFLEQIARGNWTLALPLNVHGLRLTSTELNIESNIAAYKPAIPSPAVEPSDEPAQTVSTDTIAEEPQNPAELPAETQLAQPPVSDADGTSVFESAGEALETAGGKIDRVENVVTAVTARTDAVKSLWTTIAGTAWQAAWAVFGFLIGLPKEVWIVVAIIAAALMLAYLYRQISLGKIRELS